MPERVEFKRMLLGLPQNTSDYESVTTVVRLAEVLGLNLVATLVQEAGLIDLAGLPGAREFRPFGGGWHPVEVSQLRLQLEQAATTARQLFREAVRSARIDTSFNLAQGTAAEAIGSLATADDIVVVIEPRNPAERITQQFTHLIEVAFKAAAAVMIVPCRIARTTGPVVAVATHRDDPSIRSALRIAAAIGENVILVGPLDERARASIDDLATTAGVRVEYAPAAHEPFDVAALRASLAHLRERMVVLTREAFDDSAAPAIAADRSIPVLLIEPEKIVYAKPTMSN
jgi:hypothetical protein